MGILCVPTQQGLLLLALPAPQVLADMESTNGTMSFSWAHLEFQRLTHVMLSESPETGWSGMGSSAGAWDCGRTFS